MPLLHRCKLKATKIKTSKAYVWIAPPIIESMKAWRATSSGTYIFLSATGGPQHSKNFLRRHVWPAAIKAGIMAERPERLPEGTRFVDRATSVNFQAFRRTCATWLQEHGKTENIKAHLWHATPMTTLGVYVHKIPQNVRAEGEALDAKLFGQRADGPVN